VGRDKMMMRGTMKRIILFISAILISACAPASSNSKYIYVDDDKLPKEIKLDFPITQLLTKLVDNPYPVDGFPYSVGVFSRNEQPEYVYNIPEVGRVISVSFYLDTLRGESSWSIDIRYPEIKPEDLFEVGNLKPITNSRYPWHAYMVLAGPLKGACVSDYSRVFLKNGFQRDGDRSIVIFAAPIDVSPENTDFCE
jgi:hypothetical protein